MELVSEAELAEAGEPEKERWLSRTPSPPFVSSSRKPSLATLTAAPFAYNTVVLAARKTSPERFLTRNIGGVTVTFE